MHCHFGLGNSCRHHSTWHSCLLGLLLPQESLRQPQLRTWCSTCFSHDNDCILSWNAHLTGAWRLLQLARAWEACDRDLHLVWAQLRSQSCHALPPWALQPSRVAEGARPPALSPAWGSHSEHVTDELCWQGTLGACHSSMQAHYLMHHTAICSETRKRAADSARLLHAG